MRIVAGVDCHKSTHTVVFLTGAGEVVEKLTFPTTFEGYEGAIQLGNRLGCSEWGIEGSGLYGFAFAVTIEASGSTAFEVPGAYTKRHRRQSSQHGKSDVYDAKAVAEVVLREHGRLSRFYAASLQRALRMRYDQRDRLVRERTNAANRLRGAAILIAVPELPANITPTTTARKIVALVADIRSLETSNPTISAVLDELKDAAMDIVRINAKIAALEREIRPIVRKIAPERLELHGISDISAAGLIGHAGDLRNCRNASAFAMRCGAAPIQCSSGRSETVRVNLGGDRQLNRLLHVAAMSQVRADGHPGRRYYDRKRAEGKTHLSAMRCLKRTLATVVYFRLRDTARRLEEVSLSS